MAKTYTAEELQKCDKEMLAAIILSMQDQITTLNQNMEKLIEQIAAANNHRYEQKFEKMDVIDGQLNLFNESEKLTECLYILEPEVDDVSRMGTLPIRRQTKKIQILCLPDAMSTAAESFPMC